MTPVFQTGPNCLQASIASVLDLALNEVPNVGMNGRSSNLNWLRDLRRWTKKRGLGVLIFFTSTGIPALYDSWVVAVGKTPRGGSQDHAVVCKATTRGKTVTFDYVHDPSGTEEFLTDIDYCLVLTQGAV